MSDHPTTIDLVVSVTHTRGADGSGFLRPYVTWAAGLTAVQRVQLIRSAQARLSQEQDQAMTEVDLDRAALARARQVVTMAKRAGLIRGDE